MVHFKSPNSQIPQKVVQLFLQFLENGGILTPQTGYSYNHPYKIQGKSEISCHVRIDANKVTLLKELERTILESLEETLHYKRALWYFYDPKSLGPLVFLKSRNEYVLKIESHEFIRTFILDLLLSVNIQNRWTPAQLSTLERYKELCKWVDAHNSNQLTLNGELHLCRLIGEFTDLPNSSKQIKL